MRKKLFLFPLVALLAMSSGCGHTHIPAADVPVAATCTQPGFEGGIHCAECNEVLVEGYVVEATGHTPVVDPAVPATNSAPGRTEGSHCGVCKEVLVAQTIIEKTATPATNNTQKGVLVRITNPDLAIYSAPGYDNDFVGTVGESGTYTIVAQEKDSKGNLWGKLKSGLGWINMAGTEQNTSNKTQTQQPQTKVLVRVTDPDQCIYAGPGYNYAFVRTVGEVGTYTIVEQKWDSSGNHWGKLKSGLGWIDLIEVAW